MKKFFTLLLFLPSIAWGVTYLPIDPASCVSFNSGSASCKKETYYLSGTAKGQDDVRTCLADETRGFVCKFQWPASNPSEMIPHIFWGPGVGGATSGSVCWQASGGCTTSGGEYSSWSYGTAVQSLDAAAASAQANNEATLASTVFQSSGANRICRLRIKRVRGDGTCVDNFNDKARVYWMQLEY